MTTGELDMKTFSRLRELLAGQKSMLKKIGDCEFLED